LADYALKAGAMLQVLGVWLTLRDLVAYSDRESNQISAPRWARWLLLMPSGRNKVVSPRTLWTRIRGQQPDVAVDEKAIDQGDLLTRVARLELIVRSHKKDLAGTRKRINDLCTAIESIETRIDELTEDQERRLEAARAATAAETARVNL